jgi:hypothetical protein
MKKLKFRSGFIIYSLFISLLFCIGYGQSYAQDTVNVKKWNFLADVYLMFPYMDGETGIDVDSETGIGDNLILPVDANPGDIFSKLKMAAMLYLEAKTDKWAITSDFVYMKLNQDVTPNALLESGAVTAKQLIWEPAGFYRLASFIEVGIGGRLNYLDLGIDVRRNVFPAGTEEVSGNESKTWFDPILITRLTGDIRDKWLFQFRGDLGGFGVGSEFTWQLQAYAGYRFTKVFQLTAGYRILSIDNTKGEHPKQFLFDIDEFGPCLRFGFNF